MLSRIALLLCHIYIHGWTLTLYLKLHTVSIKLKNTRPNVQRLPFLSKQDLKQMFSFAWLLTLSDIRGTNEKVALLAYKEVAKYDASLHENTNLCFSKLTHPVFKRKNPAHSYEICMQTWILQSYIYLSMSMSSWTSYQLDWLSKLHGTINEHM